jgi:nucleoside-diphosphate-sugar epimerase
VNKINVFGKGFIGGEFCNRYDVIANAKNDYYPTTPKILYFISTVDNYNIHTNPHLDIDTNLSLLISVLENCRKVYGNEFEFNFISSWFVYGKVEIPAREDSPCFPTGFYSITKRCAEQLLISYCQTYNIPYRILRMSNVIGINDQKVSKKKNALQYMIQQLVHGEEVSLYEGAILRDLIDVRDAADAIYHVLTNGNLNEIYNIGNGSGYSFEKIVYEVQEYLGTGSIKRIPIPEFHKLVQAKDFYLDVSKLHSLGFESQFSVESAVFEIADYYKAHK